MSLLDYLPKEEEEKNEIQYEDVARALLKLNIVNLPVPKDDEEYLNSNDEKFRVLKIIKILLNKYDKIDEEVNKKHSKIIDPIQARKKCDYQ